ncbi:unnamed protein product, partial [marine sediment metagenome]
MDKLTVKGGRRLRGRVEVSGAKNAALPIMAAGLLAEGPSTIRGVPALADISHMSRLLGELGVSVSRSDSGAMTVE